MTLARRGEIADNRGTMSWHDETPWTPQLLMLFGAAKIDEGPRIRLRGWHHLRRAPEPSPETKMAPEPGLIAVNLLRP